MSKWELTQIHLKFVHKKLTNQRSTVSMLATFTSCDSCQCCYLLTSSVTTKLKVEWSWPLQRKPQHAGVRKSRWLEACQQGPSRYNFLPGIHRPVLPGKLAQYVMVLPQLAGLHYVLLGRRQVAASWSNLLPPQTRFWHVVVWCRSDQLLVMPSFEQIVVWRGEFATALRRHRCVRCHRSICRTSAGSVQPGQC